VLFNNLEPVMTVQGNMYENWKATGRLSLGIELWVTVS